MTSAVLVTAAVIVNTVMVRRRIATWGMLGWPRMRIGVRGFALGLCVGLAMAVGAVALSVGLGGAEVTRTNGTLPDYLGAVASVGFVLVLAALAEELLFRGYPLSRLAEALGKVRASLGLAVLFALVHAFNPELSVLGLVNIGLAALVLSGAFFTSGALPTAWGLHLGWNGGLSLGADAPVSGVEFGVPGIDFVIGDPAWLTGGGFGPEGGLAATTVMAAALAGFARFVVRAEVLRS